MTNLFNDFWQKQRENIQDREDEIRFNKENLRRVKLGLPIKKEKTFVSNEEDRKKKKAILEKITIAMHMNEVTPKKRKDNERD